MATGQFFGHTRSSKFDLGLYLYEHLKIFLRTTMLSLWYDYEITQLQKGHNFFNIQRISEKIIENHFLYRICFTTLSRYLNLDSIKLILVRLLLLRWAIWPMALLLHVVFPLDTRFACNSSWGYNAKCV